MNKYIIFVILAAGIFAVGRYTAPEKIKVETKVVTVTKEVESKDSDLKRRKETKIVKKPDGSSETTVVEDSERNSHSHSETDIARKETKVSETTRIGGRLTTSVLVGAQPHLFNGLSVGPLVYGGAISKDILGPINVGVWALSDFTAGVSIGLSF